VNSAKPGSLFRQFDFKLFVEGLIAKLPGFRLRQVAGSLIPSPGKIPLALNILKIQTVDQPDRNIKSDFNLNLPGIFTRKVADNFRSSIGSLQDLAVILDFFNKFIKFTLSCSDQYRTRLQLLLFVRFNSKMVLE
jgi:hypothetical protein